MSDIEEASTVADLALVQGEPYADVPQDLYIPPDALKVILSSFEGPMDLLLYLIKKQNLDILDIPIAKVAAQYMHYIELMQEMQLELAADYLVMAAVLAELKSRMLLPKPKDAYEDEEDPRLLLMQKLRAYEQFKQLAELIDQIARQDRDTFQASEKMDNLPIEIPQPKVGFSDLLGAFKGMCLRIRSKAEHRIELEYLSVRERMTDILSRIDRETYTQLEVYLSQTEGRVGVVVTLLAILELMKQHTLDVVQSEPYQTIYIKGLVCPT